MNDEQRAVAKAVVDFYATVEPVERRFRRSDWALAVSAGATVAAFGFIAYGLTGWLTTVYVVCMAVMGFVFGRASARIESRRQAFAALKSAHEEASLELAVDDAE